MPAKKYPNGLTRRQLKKANPGSEASSKHRPPRWIQDAGPVTSKLQGGVVKAGGR